MTEDFVLDKKALKKNPMISQGEGKRERDFLSLYILQNISKMRWCLEIGEN